MNRHISLKRAKEPPRNRLERWLVRKLQGGALRSLPRYQPVGGCEECPEHYAQTLLAGLRSAGDDPRTLERLKDDGRAFRSWAERPRSNGDFLGGHRPHGFACC